MDGAAMANKRRDKGIVTLPNNVKIQEETRDRLAKLVNKDGTPTRTTAPSAYNPDNATTEELKEHKFSGYRVNTFTNDVELWCVGKIMVRRNLAIVQNRPQTLMDMHEEAFLTAGSVLMVPMSEGVKALQGVTKH